VAVTLAPGSRLITSDYDEPSAYAPWTSTTLGFSALSGHMLWLPVATLLLGRGR
jgi:hypothetical protein